MIGRYVTLERSWKKGDELLLKFDIPTRVETCNHHQTVVHGPVVLARDSRFHDGNGNIVILFNGFQKKSQKTPKQEIDKAINLKNQYYADK